VRLAPRVFRTGNASGAYNLDRLSQKGSGLQSGVWKDNSNDRNNNRTNPDIGRDGSSQEQIFGVTRAVEVDVKTGRLKEYTGGMIASNEFDSRFR